MFESAEIGRAITKQDFDAAVPRLRADLVSAQIEIKRLALGPIVVIVSGVDGAGKGAVVHRLNEWLDPRGVDTHAFWDLPKHFNQMPYFWRFWQAMPQRGRIGILFGSWYTQPILRRVYGDSSDSELDIQLAQIDSFERMLVADGAVLIKLWFHVTKQTQERRLRGTSSDIEVHWRMLPDGREHQRLYSKFVRVSEHALRATSRPGAKWTLLEAYDPYYRDLATGRAILRSLRRALSAARVRTTASPRPRGSLPTRPSTPPQDILRQVDLTRSYDASTYRTKLEKYQNRLSLLAWEAYRQRVGTVLVFEGWDAAGKGSGIRRVTAAMDPRLYRVVPVAAPTDEERAHHYLWRFWRHIPRAGWMTLFDRSWYGRVLVERVEELATHPEWNRAYDEINDFEHQLADHGTLVLKFWIHISKEEQLRRFQERALVPHKQHKITEEDRRNRRKWDAYALAVNEMVARTSTSHAPWTLIPGNCKKFARVAILKSICKALDKAL